MRTVDSQTPQKLRGGYYTPPDVAAFLTRWATRHQPTRLLEPSCGDGVFFDALAKVRCPSVLEVRGCELDPAAASRARAAAAALSAHSDIHHEDFLQWVLQEMDRPADFDAVIGNPPFIRFQFLEASQQDRSQQIARKLNAEFTRHTNAWVPFVLASLQRLRPGGRLAMVVPAELLHVIHARPVRHMLLDTCAQVFVLEPEELWFAGTTQAVVLLLAEKKTHANPRRARLGYTQVRGRAFCQTDPEDTLDTVAQIPGDQLTDKWTLALLSARSRDALDEVNALPSVRSFHEIATVRVGIVTGANRFFLVPDSVVDKYSLHALARPMFGRSGHIPGVVYDHEDHARNRAAGLPANFIHFGSSDGEALCEGARQYITTGLQSGLHERYKCRIRTPWYHVNSVSAAPVGMPKRAHDFPRMVLNTMGALSTDTAYRVYPRDVHPAALVRGFVNSLTALCAELEGRHYGVGVLELVPSEIGRLRIPIPETPDDLQELDRAIRGRRDAEIILQRQDRAILEPMGADRRTLNALTEGWLRLRSRRRRRRRPDTPAAA